jgi:N-methylhydantoinase A
VDWAEVAAQYAAMEAEARALIVEAGAAPGDVTFRRSADMRYVGQGFDIPVPLPESLDAASVERAFLDAYERLFDRRIEGLPMEVLSWRLHATASRPEVPGALGRSIGGEARKGTRDVWFPQTGMAPCAVYDRYRLAPGVTLRGPAVVEERESTTVIGPDASFTLDAQGNLVIEIDQGS